MDTTSVVALTLLHFVWQGALVSVAAAVGFRVLKGNGPSPRYGLGVLALAAMAILPIVTAARLQSLPESSSPMFVATTEEPTADREAAAPVSSSSKVENASAKIPSADAPTDPSKSAVSVLTPGRFRFREWTEAAAPYLVRVWLAGVLLFSFRLLMGWLGVRRLARIGVQEPVELIRERFEEISRRINTSRPVRLIESALVRTPATIGFLRPALLWPVSLHTGLTVSQIDLLLAHELAHLKRHDYLVNVLQTILETALFYHPGVWWLSKRVRDERELCCDDVALEMTGDPRAYAEALLALESWRQDLPVLATGATGGSLMTRIHRLITAEEARDAGRPRFAALPLGIAAVASILALAPQAPASSVTAPESAAAVVSESERPQPVGPAQAGPVSRYVGQGSLEARMDWAMKEASSKGLTRFWIGYAIAADPSRNLLYMDRITPVSTTDGSTFSGRMHFQRADGMRFRGVRLESVIGERSAEETVIFLGFGGPSLSNLERIHAGTSVLPVHFEGRPVLWLDRANDTESIAWIRRFSERVTSRDIRNDLVALVGAHIDSAPVFAALRAWVESNEPDELRASAVEELGPVALKEALTLLERTARNDRSRDVRREAAEALGEQPAPEATRILGDLARSVKDIDVAREAAESLGERTAPEAFDELVALVWSDIHADVRREAVEAMGENGSPRAPREIERVARTHPTEDVRREAVETLGELQEPGEAVALLKSIAETDASDSIRDEAVETIAGIEGGRSIEVLYELAAMKTATDVRTNAIEALFEKGQIEKGVVAVKEMVKSDDLRTAVAAVELLGDVDSKETVALLESIARTDARPRIQSAAAEALGDAAPVDEAFRALRDLAAQHPREEVQRRAVEAMGDIELAGVLKELDHIARTHASEQVRVTAVEAMDADKDAETKAVLTRLATEAGSDRVREAAVEAWMKDGPTPEQAAWLWKQMATDAPAHGPADRRVQMALLDGFEEMGSRGIELVISVLRSTKDREIRKKAMEVLAESDDPRAKKELARILEP
jgi:beta-lactamase regulating signal transducer with metallopeptidase domain/HEAT repeat protein